MNSFCHCPYFIDGYNVTSLLLKVFSYVQPKGIIEGAKFVSAQHNSNYFIERCKTFRMLSFTHLNPNCTLQYGVPIPCLTDNSFHMYPN